LIGSVLFIAWAKRSGIPDAPYGPLFESARSVRIPLGVRESWLNFASGDYLFGRGFGHPDVLALS
jgi:hypothetical protein